MQSKRTTTQFSLIAALSASSALHGCDDQSRRTESQVGAAVTRSPTSPQSTAEAVQERPPSIDQVKEAPRSFYGERVRVAGDVEEFYGDRAFELEGSGWAFGDNITVLTRTPVTFVGEALKLNDELVVTGIVRRFVTAEIERELGWDLEPELETRLRERPVLVADTIRRTTEYGRWSAEGAADRAPITSVLAVAGATQPGALAGRPVEFRREPVRSLMGKGLWVGPSHMSQVFVLPQQMPQNVKTGDLVEVRGTLRKAPQDAAQAWNLRPEAAGVVTDETLFVDAATVNLLPRAQARPGT